MLTIDLKALALRDGERLLDLGCGSGRHLHGAYYSTKIEAFGVDKSFDEVVKTLDGFQRYPDLSPGAECRFRLAAADCLNLPFRDESFDVVICSEVLEHLPEYNSALAEISRVMRPNGRLAISVPRFWPEWICWHLAEGYHTAPGGHVRIFHGFELRAAIEQAGFAFHRQHYAHGLHSPYWWLQCLIWRRRGTSRLVKLYHHFLVWDMMRRPLLTRVLSAIADPLMGKSLVLYFSKRAP